MSFPKPADIQILGVSEVRTVNAEHYVRSECGNWLTVWETHEGTSDMKVPRERVVVIEPRDAERETSEAKRDARTEVKA